MHFVISRVLYLLGVLWLQGELEQRRARAARSFRNFLRFGRAKPAAIAGLVFVGAFAESCRSSRRALPQKLSFNGIEILTQFLATLWLGVTPQCFLDAIHCSVANLLNT